MSLSSDEDIEAKSYDILIYLALLNVVSTRADSTYADFGLCMQKWWNSLSAESMQLLAHLRKFHVTHFFLGEPKCL